MNTPQVQRNHYEFAKYAYPGRFASYYYQLRTVIDLKPHSLLEVGVGDGIFAHYVTNHTNIAHQSLDFAEDLHPDVVGSVLNIPCTDGSFDVACCFEVLEHVPYEDVPQALSELTRVARRAVAISVPHFGPRTQINIKIPFVPELKWAAKVPWPRKHVFGGEHYWELGKHTYSPKNFYRLLQSYGKVVEDFVPYENQYHHFYVLEVPPRCTGEK